ncbi:hypothetical protein V8F33_005004 [Rhypophila sp. PSN 637]
MKLVALAVGCITSVVASPLLTADTAEITTAGRLKPRSFIPYTINSLRCQRDEVVQSEDVIEAVSMLGDRPGRPQLEPDCDGHGRTCQQVSCHNDNAVVLCASTPNGSGTHTTNLETRRTECGLVQHNWKHRAVYWEKVQCSH